MSKSRLSRKPRTYSPDSESESEVVVSSRPPGSLRLSRKAGSVVETSPSLSPRSQLRDDYKHGRNASDTTVTSGTPLKLKTSQFQGQTPARVYRDTFVDLGLLGFGRDRTMIHPEDLKFPWEETLAPSRAEVPTPRAPEEDSFPFETLDYYSSSPASVVNRRVEWSECTDRAASRSSSGTISPLLVDLLNLILTSDVLRKYCKHFINELFRTKKERQIVWDSLTTLYPRDVGFHVYLLHGLYRRMCTTAEHGRSRVPTDPSIVPAAASRIMAAAVTGDPLIHFFTGMNLTTQVKVIAVSQDKNGDLITSEDEVIEALHMARDEKWVLEACIIHLGSASDTMLGLTCKDGSRLIFDSIHGDVKIDWSDAENFYEQFSTYIRSQYNRRNIQVTRQFIFLKTAFVNKQKRQEEPPCGAVSV